MIASVVVLAWGLIYGIRAFEAHMALRTNAYDLSLFDYALWSTGRTGLGDVPFIGHSLFSHHFMPTLMALWPAYQAWPSPAFLIAVQIAAFAIAAVLLYRLLPDDLPTLPAIAILVAFLFGRRSHSAANAFFYLESLEPLLVFALLLAWRARRHALAAVFMGLALGCKEDMVMYLAAFGAFVFFRESRRKGMIIAAVCVAWLLVAMVVAIPAARTHDGLPPSNPFVEASFGSDEAVERSAMRLTPARAIEVVTIVTASAGFLCWFAPALTAIMLPGLLVTLQINPHTVTAGITGHYLFPVLPWVFAAAAVGAGRLQGMRPRLLAAMSVILLLGTVADSPLWRVPWRTSAEDRAAAAVIRRELARIPDDAPVLTMPNLVPHLPHRERIWTIGVGASPDDPEYVAISAIGSLWPLDPDTVQAEIAKYQSDSRFTRIGDGPLHIFQRTR